MLHEQTTTAPPLEESGFTILADKLNSIEVAVNRILTKQVEKPPKYYSIEETCELLGNISRSTLSEYTKDGLIEAGRIGGRVLYAEEAIRAAVIKINNRSSKK